MGGLNGRLTCLGDEMTPQSRIIIFTLSAIAAAIMLSGCGTTGHVSMLNDVTYDEDTKGQNPVCTVDIQKPLTDRLSARYMHQSWCFTGFPFNDNPESTLDAIGIDLKLW